MKIKLFFLAALLAAFSGSLFAQGQTNASLSNPYGGSLSASSTNCSVQQSCAWQKLPNTATTTTVTITGTFSATLILEYSADSGNTWTQQSSQTAPAVVTFTSTSYTDVRVRCSAFTSGAASIVIQTAGNQINVNNGGGLGNVVLSGTPSAGQVPTATSPTAATWQAGSGLPSSPTSPNGSPQVLECTPSAGACTAAYGLLGITSRAVTGTTSTDSVTNTDCNNDIDYQGSVAVTSVTIPTATTLGVPQCTLVFHNDTNGAGGNVTLSPTTWQIKAGSTTASTLVLSKGQSVKLVVDAAGGLWDGTVYGGTSGGTVTSVSQTMPAQFGVSGSGGTTAVALADTWTNPNTAQNVDVFSPFPTWPNTRVTRGITASPSGAFVNMGEGISEAGTNCGSNGSVAATSSAPVMCQDSTGTTIDTPAGIGGTSAGTLGVHRTGRTHGIMSQFAGSFSTLSTIRVFRGLSTQTTALQVAPGGGAGSDVPAGNYVGFMYSTTGTYTGLSDTTHFVCVQADGTTQNAVSSGVSADTSFHYFALWEDRTNSSWHYYIDNVEVCGTGQTAHIPTTSTNLDYRNAVMNLAASNVQLNTAWVVTQDDK